MSRALLNGMAWCAAVLAFAALAAAAEPEGWSTDFEQAKKTAVARNLPILMNFAASDWCVWCQRLDAEVLAQKTFKDYAKDNLVLFLADFSERAKQTNEVRKQNLKLQSSYRVCGYPTVILVNAQGEETARSGYLEGGAEAYVAHLKGLLAPRTQPEPAPVAP